MALDREITRIDQAGRIVLPARYRQQLGLRAGDELVITLDESEIRLKTPAQALRRLQALVKQSSKGKRSMVEELLAERRREAKRELRRH